MRTSFLVVIALATICGSVASAAVYDNGLGNPASAGNEFSQWVQADDFVLPAASSVNAARITWENYFNHSWSNTARWWIFNDNAGSPRSILASGNGSAFQTVSLGTGYGGGSAYDTTFSFGTSINLAGGQRFWFGLNWATTTSTRQDFYWLYGGGAIGMPTYESNYGTFDNWSVSPPSPGNDRAFQLLNVPVPASAAMFSIAGVVLCRRRRSNLSGAAQSPPAN